MAGTRQTTETANRRAKVADLYLRGHSQYEIARLLRTSQPTISRDLEAIRQQWLVNAAINFDAHVAKELARLDRLEYEAWKAWERSVGTHEKKTIKSGGDTPGPTPANVVEDGQPQPISPPGPTPEVTVVTEKLAGDPRFQSIVQKCIERRCHLLGLDAPKRVDLTSGGKPILKVVSPDVADAV